MLAMDWTNLLQACIQHEKSISNLEPTRGKEEMDPDSDEKMRTHTDGWTCGHKQVPFSETTSKRAGD
ncbi:hypothetical protein DPMN_010559 [Dreissena polymorpha]|uniref:Uncharacterized protein n=1 Tax=Dreissena polymorpha TaxID=45954 RepID=A0A9D4MYZ7_DREPO|nr:hypothetical protein DPMN_010559 [Dreissena polymorpha]